MTIRLSENLRRLRRQAGLTQAALATQLGVSDRAVSRWERNEALPDLTLLPRLALLLDVSTDALLGVDPARMEAEILQATEECTALLNRDDAPGAITLLRRLLAQYPNQPELMVYLARALLHLNTTESAREALALCRRADGRPMRLSSTFGCKQVMALALKQLGQCEQAARLVSDEMPAIWVCRELMLARVAPPETARRIHRSNVQLLSSLLASALRQLGKDGHPELIDLAQRIRLETETLLPD
ncbi:MAG: helix-turn-helix domain-containing protein [Clostridia bacterium]|nr:helix-turn-helix domain-containing protein [Clostridia bacterium]